MRKKLNHEEGLGVRIHRTLNLVEMAVSLAFHPHFLARTECQTFISSLDGEAKGEILAPLGNRTAAFQTETINLVTEVHQLVRNELCHNL